MIPKSRLIRYLIVGGIAYVLEITVLYLLHYVLGLSSVKAVAISFWFGFVIAFALQKVVTFENYEKRPHILSGQVIGYSLLVAWNYGFTLAAVKVLSNHLSVIVIRTTVIMIVTVWNFVIYKRLFQNPAIHQHGPTDQ